MKINQQKYKKIGLYISHNFILTHCNSCKMSYVVLAVYENEKEYKDEPITYNWSYQLGTKHCPYCGVKINSYINEDRSNE